MDFIAPDGTRLFYSDFGSGEPVVLLHSWSLSSTMWEYQVDALLAAGYRCIALDRRGHGRSDVPSTGYDINTLADDVAGLIEHLDLQGVTLVAHSMGTCEATRYLSQHGTARVSRAVFLGAMTPFLQGATGPGHLEAWFDLLRTDRPKWFHDSAPGYFATDGTGSWVSQALVDDGIRSILTVPLQVQIACVRAFATVDLSADLTAIDVPVLLLHGTADQSAPIEITGHPTAGLLRKGRLVELPGAPHGLYVTAKDQVNAEILEFMA
ncbi:alpha/beta fold hydrolase [Pseudonocardia sp. TRM90224]|uniref:alpha/beta fold hydrolase n=1 Tax=Pseudonocardia sp. TRM90224 TaxID=2812678 RepID=UPI001E6547FC|nr:alpha/beta hydrolase [Pseudonocardia sp. TRM90224]